MSGLIRLDAIERLGPLRLIKAGGGGWYNAPAYADMSHVADHNRQRYAITTVPLADIPTATPAQLAVKRPCKISDIYVYNATRSGDVGAYTDAGGTLRFLSTSDVPRYDRVNGKLQFALNSQSANQIVNNMMVGGSAGVLPTGWALSSGLTGNGIAADVSAPFTDKGVRCVDIRYHGTATATVFASLITYQASSLTLATSDSTFSAAVYLALAAGSFADVNEVVHRVSYGNSGGSILTTTTTPNLTGTLTGSLQRVSVTGSASDATTARVYTDLTVRISSGAVVDFTLRIGLPQLEAQPLSTPVIPTSGTAVTRAIESARYSPVIEAILQRSAASVVIRGQNMGRPGGRVLGAAVPGTSVSFIRGAGNAPNPAFINGGTPNLSSTDGNPLPSSSWAVAIGYSAAGRALVRDGGVVRSDANPIIQDRSTVWLGRESDGTFGDGWYDFDCSIPEKASDARLTELAVPA